jgi:hypothetical protein
MPTEAKFCPVCGKPAISAKVSNPSAAAPTGTSPEETVPALPTPLFRSVLFWFGVVSLVCELGLILPYYMSGRAFAPPNTGSLALLIPVLFAFAWRNTKRRWWQGALIGLAGFLLIYTFAGFMGGISHH